MPLRDDRSDSAFVWAEPERTEVFGAVPRPGLEVSLVLRRGAVNNADLYLAVPDTWLTGAPAGDLLIIPTLHLYRIVSGTRHLLRIVQIADTDNGVQWQRVNGSTIKFQLIIARGFPCDGFEVTVSCPTVVLSGAGFGSPCSGRMFSWGSEASGEPIGGIETSQGPPIDVNVISAIPVTVVGIGAASAWDETNGRAPDNTVADFVPLSSAVATQYVEISAASTNPGTIYVASAALSSGGSDGAAYELQAGDSVRIAIDNADKVFVAGSDAVEDYRVAIV